MKHHLFISLILSVFCGSHNAAADPQLVGRIKWPFNRPGEEICGTQAYPDERKNLANVPVKAPAKDKPNSISD